jgi:phage baseplate assembly protein W
VTTGFEFGPFGTGTPVDAPEPPRGLTTLCRFLDPVSQDFTVNTVDGHLEQMPPVRQRFLLLLSTLVGSSSTLPTLGIEVPRIIDDSFERQVDAAVRVGARQMTEIEKVARIDKVTVQATSLGRVAVLVAYQDLTLGVSDNALAALP